LFLPQRAKLNLHDLRAEARLQIDIKATKTIVMMIVAYFFSYVPAIVYAVVGNKEKSQADSWFAFFAWYAVSFSSAVNPIIYYLRTSRYRSAFSQFIKDPFGSSDCKEKPRCRVKAAKKRILKGAGTTRKKGEEILSGSVVEEKYHGERRNGILALSIEALDAHLFVFEAGQSIVDGREKLNKSQRSFLLNVFRPVLSKQLESSSPAPDADRRSLRCSWTDDKENSGEEKEEGIWRHRSSIRRQKYRAVHEKRIGR